MAPALGLEDGVKWSGSVRMQDDWPGIVVSVSGEPQHVIAAGEFVPLPVDESPGQFDWRDGMWATVAMEVDKFAEGLWPENPAASQVIRRLIVDLGDDYRQHYVAEFTVVGIDKDGSKISTSGGFVRDDSPRLQALARLIFEWYRTERQSLEISLGYVTAKLKVGQLVTTIGKDETLQTVNSVVTTVRYDFGETDAGQTPTARMVVTTQFAEFDARRFVGQD